MKKLVELKEERRSLVEELNSLLNTAQEAQRDLSEDETSQWEEKKSQVEKLDKQIERAEEQERLNQTIVSGNVRNQDDGEAQEMQREFNLGKALNELASGGNISGFEKEIAEEGKKEMRDSNISTQPNALYIPNTMLRADPYLSTSNTDIINKKVKDNLSIVKSDAQALLEDMGVKIYTGLNGEFVAPSMDAVDSGFVSENSASSSYGVTTAGLKLAPRRVGGNQAFSREFLGQTNATIYQSILQDFNDSVWRAVASDLFDQFTSDANDASVSISGSSLAYTDVLELLKANTGGTKGKYVAPQDVAIYLMDEVTASGIGHIWNERNTIRGYDAIMTEFANDGELYYGNWKQAAVGQWGGIELIVDPYSSKNKGQIEIAVNGMFDTGIVNSGAFKFIPDCSIA